MKRVYQSGKDRSKRQKERLIREKSSKYGIRYRFRNYRFPLSEQPRKQVKLVRYQADQEFPSFLSGGEIPSLNLKSGGQFSKESSKVGGRVTSRRWLIRESFLSVFQ